MYLLFLRDSIGELYKMFLRILTVICLSSLHLSESLTLQIEGNKTSFSFPLGVVSEIKFYVRNGQDSRIYVLLKTPEKIVYDTKCIVSQSASKGCISSHDICRCPTDTDGAFSLNKTFQQTDAGLWMFKAWQHDDPPKTVNVTISDSDIWTLLPVVATASTDLLHGSETFSTARVLTDTPTQKATNIRTVSASVPTTSVQRVSSVIRTTVSQIISRSSSTTFTRAAFSHGSATDSLRMTGTDAAVIAIIVVLSFITLLVIVLTLVVWRRPGIILKLRGAPAIDGGGDNLYLENPSDYPLPHRQASTCDPREQTSNDYQTHVFDTSANILPISNSTSECFRHAPAFCQTASREQCGRRTILSIFGAQLPTDDVPNAQEGVCKLMPSSNAGCTYVNPSATTDIDDDYLTPIIDFKAYMIETRLTKAIEGESASAVSPDSTQSSASDDDGSLTRYSEHQDHGIYMTTVRNHTDGATVTGKAPPGRVCEEPRDEGEPTVEMLTTSST